MVRFLIALLAMVLVVLAGWLITFVLLPPLSGDSEALLGLVTGVMSALVGMTVYELVG